jgi:hypothetical protein
MAELRTMFGKAPKMEPEKAMDGMTKPMRQAPAVTEAV